MDKLTEPIIQAYSREIEEYGDILYFADAIGSDFTHIAFGSGQWVVHRTCAQCVRGIFALYGPNKWVRTVERFGRRGRADVTSGKQFVSYSKNHFERHVQKFKVAMGPKVSLAGLIAFHFQNGPKTPQPAQPVATPPATSEPVPVISGYVPPRAETPFRPYQEQSGYKTYQGKQSSLGLVSPHDTDLGLAQY